MKALKIIIAILAIGGIGVGSYFIFFDEKDVPKKEVEVAEEIVTYQFPYRGTETDNEEATMKRPLSVKIDNSRPARPQSGVNSADVVYETITEGGETRLNCIFQSNVPKQIGPVRSARLSDAWIIPQYKGMLFNSGENSQVRNTLDKVGIDDMSHSAASELYERVNFKSMPHNLYLNTKRAYKVAKKLEYETSYDDLTPLEYGENKNIENTTAGSVTINYNSKVKWDWDPEREMYMRSMSDEPFIDEIDEKQVEASNIVILKAVYTQQTKVDAAGSPTYDISLIGEGDAILFQNGVKYEGSWVAESDAPPIFKDKDGNIIKLAVGKTWFEVPMDDTKIETTEESPLETDKGSNDSTEE